MDTITAEISPVKPSPFMRAMIWIAGVDEDTLHQCPPHDWDCARATALLFIAVWIYQSAILSIVAHQLLAQDGQIHPELVLGAMFIATLVLLIDSYVFLRAGYHADGLAELKRGGLDLTGGMSAKLKAGVFLGLRILLSLGLAQLTAIFVGLILFRADITAEINHQFATENAALIAAAKLHVAGEIGRATDAANDASAQMKILQQEVDAMRDGAVDPAAGDAGVRAEQDEIGQLLAEQAQRDSELSAAQTFASNELAGVKGDPTNSGIPGDGPVRRAALERVRTANANDEAGERSLDKARSRLDDLRAQAASHAGDRAGRAQAELPELQRDLQAQTAETNALRANLVDLTAHRDEAVRTEVENSPDCVDRDQGMIAQLSALRRVAQDPEIAVVILLIDFTSFGLELAAVLAKVTSFIPTTFSALLARDAYMRVVKIVDEMDAVLNRRAAGHDAAGNDENDDALPPIFAAASPEHDMPHAETAADENSPSDDGITTGTDITDNTNLANGESDKRPRGRPRKYALS